MAVTQNTYTGNGSTVLYSFTFPYLDTTDIKVSVNGTITTAYTLANATTIQFNTAPANGAAIRIYRETDDSGIQSTFFAGSAIRSQDLNNNFTQTLYLSQESVNEADSATATANTALTNSNTAISTANTAVSTANSAVSSANTAVSTANTASTNATAAVNTANTASSNASAAVSTANAASASAASAVTTANGAVTTANGAVTTANAATSTANSALSAANSAVSTANTASSNASAAVSTANTASTNASAAVSTANTASSNATTAVSTANSAVTTANAAAAAVANAVLYTTVANVTAIPGTPANNTAVEITDSTGIESFTPLSGLPGGFVGSSGLSARIIYQTVGSTWTWIQYFPNDPESRYLKLSGGTLTGQLRGDDSTSASTPGFAFDGDPNTGIGRPGADELALITGGTARLTIDPAGAVAVAGSLSQGGNAVVVTTDSRLSDTRVPTDGSVTNAKVAAAAAIDGTKISPNFGSQNVVTTGTVSGASLIPTSSSVPTNGVYLPSANNVAISTNGSGRLFVDASGRVLVGTSTSLSTNAGFTPNLQVAGTVTDAAMSVFQYRNATGAGGSLTLSHSRGASVGTQTILQNGDSFGILLFEGSDGTNPVQGALIKGEVDGTPGTNDMPGRIVLSTTADGASSPTERMRIDSAGRVGIGTTSPATNLHVAGNVLVRESDYIYGNATTGNRSYIQMYGSASGEMTIATTFSNSFIKFLTADTERARIDSSGRLLVGTSTSMSAGGQAQYAKFQIIGSTASATGQGIISIGRGQAASGAIGANNDIGYINFTDNAGNEFAQIGCLTDATTGSNDYPGRLVFATTADGASSPTEVMRLSGGVGFVANLQGSTAWIAATSSGASGSVPVFACRRNASAVNNGTDVFYVYSNGSYATISDVNQKKNIESTRDGYLEDLSRLRVVKYNWNDQEDTEPRELGLIAQEVEEVFPGLVSETHTDGAEPIKGIKYSVLPVMLLKALQEAKTRIETLEAEVAALKAQ